eukprot:gene24232-27413_t
MLGSQTVLILVGVFVCVAQLALAVPPVNSIPVKIINHAGAPIEVYWIDTFSNDGTIVKQTAKPLRNSSDAHINSYDGHQFVAKFLNEVEGAEAYFTKGPSEETVIVEYDSESNVMTARQITKFDEIMDLINEATKTCNNLEDSTFTDCIKSKVVEEAKRLTDTTNEIRRYRDLMSPRLNSYVCADDMANVSTALKVVPFDDRRERYNADLMVDTDRAKVWVMKKAITAKECEILARRSVAAVAPASQTELSMEADGSSVVVSAQANGALVYELDAEAPEKDPLWPLYSRIIKVTNAVGKQGIPVLPIPQEKLNLLTYEEGTSGLGTHFHGKSKFQPGDRVASALLFCQTAAQGGQVTFPKADIVLTPETGMGVFYSYKSATTGDMDDGYSEMSGCPVRGGNMVVASLHLRSGTPVLALENATAGVEGSASGSAELGPA